MLSIELSNNLIKLDKQIQAIEWQLRQDMNDKDIRIHTEALNNLKAHRYSLKDSILSAVELLEGD